MPHFDYRALNRQTNKEVKGSIEASSQPEAIATLKKDGLLPIEVRPGRARKGGGGGDQVEPADLHRSRDPGEAVEVGERELHPLVVQPPGLVHAAAQAAQNPFVEDRRGRAVQLVEHHEADRVGADVDHADARFAEAGGHGVGGGEAG